MSERITIVLGRNLRGIARDMVERPITPDWYYAVLRRDDKIADCRGGWADRAECVQDAKDHWEVISAAARALGRLGGASRSERKVAASRANGKRGGRPKQNVGKS